MIDVAFTPAELRPADVVVVIDVLRATSTATQALAAGYRRVLCVETLEQALSLRRCGRVLAAERRCVKPPGFDRGNSPLEAMEPGGEELVLATTNGAPAIVAASRQAPTVLLASLLNLGAVLQVLRALQRHGDLGVQIVCPAADGLAGFEDVYVTAVGARMATVAGVAASEHIGASVDARDTVAV